MKYLFSDFYFLCGAAEKGVSTVGEAYRHMVAYMVHPVGMPCLLHAVRGLVAGGYITVEPAGGCITPDTPLAVTDTGRRAVAISAIQKLWGEEKVFRKNELKFCTLDRPEETVGGDWVCEDEGFSTITGEMLRGGDISFGLFELTEVGDGLLRLTVHHPDDEGDFNGETDDEDGEEAVNDPDAAETFYSVSITGKADTVMQGLSDLMSVAYALLTEPPRTRKVAIHGADKSLVITFAQAASEHGTVLRMTVAQIRFNRQRFYGKRDGDLDYAQCGDPLMTLDLTSPSAIALYLLPAAVSLPSRTDADTLSLVSRLHTIVTKG